MRVVLLKNCRMKCGLIMLNFIHSMNGIITACRVQSFVFHDPTTAPSHFSRKVSVRRRRVVMFVLTRTQMAERTNSYNEGGQELPPRFRRQVGTCARLQSIYLNVKSCWPLTVAKPLNRNLASLHQTFLWRAPLIQFRSLPVNPESMCRILIFPSLPRLRTRGGNVFHHFSIPFRDKPGCINIPHRVWSLWRVY
jgi:hypothetical protein